MMSRYTLFLAALLVSACDRADPDPAPMVPHAEPTPDAEPAPEPGPDPEIVHEDPPQLYPGPCAIESTVPVGGFGGIEGDGRYAYRFDARGRLAERLYRSGDPVSEWDRTWRYDDDDRVIEEQTRGWEDGQLVERTYVDGILRLRRQTDFGIRGEAESVSAEHFDAAGRPTIRSTERFEVVEERVEWTYVDARLVSRLRTTYEAGAPDDPGYGVRRDYEYDADGVLRGFTDTVVDDERIDLIGVVSYPEGGTVMTRYESGDGRLLYTETEIRDAADRLLLFEQVLENGDAMIERAWRYDDAGRERWRKDGLIEWTTTYDDAGNRRTVSRADNGEEMLLRTFTYQCFTDPSIDPATWLDDEG